MTELGLDELDLDKNKVWHRFSLLCINVEINFNRLYKLDTKQ